MRHLFLVAVLASVLLGCTTAPRSVLTDVESNPSGSLRLMQVLEIANENTLSSSEAYDRLIRGSYNFISPAWNVDKERQAILHQLRDAGINRNGLTKWGVAIGRIYCCGGPYEFVSRQFAFVPEEIQVQKYDIVVVKIGHDTKTSQSAETNLVTRLVHRYQQPPHICRWVPNDSHAWNRILYCDGLKEDGWTYHEPLLRDYGQTWIKAPQATATQMRSE